MLKEIIAPYLDSNAFSGAILVAKDGEVLHRAAFGYASLAHRVKATPETRFQIASVSKPFTAVAIMQLVERGLLEIETPLSEFAPDLVNADNITIGHLLGHRSGLPNINLSPEYDNLSKIGVTLSELVEIFKTYEAEFEPGERYQYSNTNYNLLAYIIEQAAELQFGEFLQQNIFGPLSMFNTTHPENPAEIIPDLAEGYSPAGTNGLEKAPYLDWSIKTGNGSLISTVDDLYQFDRALYSENLISKASYRLMVDRGYGFFGSDLEGYALVYINGRSPGFTARLNRFTDDDLCIIVLSNNYTTVVVDEISELIAGKILGFEAETTQISEVVSLDREALTKYEGFYRYGEDFFVPNLEFEILAGDGCWIYKAARAVTPLSSTGLDTFFARLYWSTGGFKDGKFYITFSGTNYYADKLD